MTWDNDVYRTQDEPLVMKAFLTSFGAQIEWHDVSIVAALTDVLSFIKLPSEGGGIQRLL